MLQLDELQSVLHKRVDQIDMTNIEERAAFESITGRSGEAALQLQEVGKRFAGYNDELARVQAEIKKKGPGTEEAQAAADEFNRVMGKEIGVVLSGKGERFRTVKDKEGVYDEAATQKAIAEGTAVAVGNTFQSLIMGLGDELRGLQAVKEDTALAREISSDTTDMTRILEQVIENVLERIYTSVDYIANLLGMGKSGPAMEAKTRRYAMAQMTDELNQLSKRINDKKRSIRKASSPEEKRRLESELLGAQLEYSDKSASLREIRARAGQQTGIETVEGWQASGRLWSAGRKSGMQRPDLVSSVAGATPSWMLPRESSTHFDEFREGGPTVNLSPEDQREDDRRLREQTGVIKDTTTEQTKALIRDRKEASKEDRMKKVAEALFGTGGLKMEEALKMAEGIVGGGPLDPSLRARLEEEVAAPGSPEGAPKSTRATRLMELTGEMAGGPVAHDYLLQIGAGGRVKFSQRIDSADQVTATASKAGGALSRAGAGGAQVVHNHFYNDGKGIFASMKKWQQANGQG